MNFRQKLIEARKAAGMTQEELALAVHVTRSTVSSWERGRTKPDVETIKLLSGVLKYDFISGEFQDGAPEEGASAFLPAIKPKSRRGVLIAGAATLLALLVVCFIFFVLPALKGGKGTDDRRTAEAVRLGPTDLPGAVEMDVKDLLLAEPDIFTIEWFKQDNPIASGEPYIEFRTKLSVMGPETSSGGVTMWDWTLLFYEMTGRPFRLTRVDEFCFTSRESYQHYTYGAGMIWYGDDPDTHWEFGGRMPVQPLQGYGYIIYGTDEAGNELSFRAWLDLSTAPKK